MNSFEIVPAIDLIGGKVVRLFQGEFDKKTEYGDPLDVAKRFEDAGLSRLHLVDLDGAKEGSPRHLYVLEEIASRTALHVDFGGGIRTEGDVKLTLSAGAHMVCLGSIAARQPDMVREWRDVFGLQTFILAADVRGDSVAVSGWLEDSGLRMEDFLAPFIDRGPLTVLCTDIARDGAMTGPSVDLYYRLKARWGDSIRLLASGGVTSIEDLRALKECGASGAILGRALLEGHIALEELVRTSW